MAHENQDKKPLIRLLVLDPRHFHAALLQKHTYPQISHIVNVYAPKGPEIKAHLALINSFNNRPINPTNWCERVYTGANYLQRMLTDHAGDVVIISGHSSQKMNYLLSSIEASFNVFADKPMATTRDDFTLLRRVFELAEEKKVLLCDIMTERFNVTNIIQRELIRKPGLFGILEKGSPEKPAVVIESIHQLHKMVDGKTLRRPSWFFDTNHQGAAIADVGTHLVDLVQWMCFPDQVLDWRTDIKIISSNRWPTKLSLAQFKAITGLNEFPYALKSYVTPDKCLLADKNGEVLYILRGVHVLVRTLWNFSANPGLCDTQRSMVMGSKADLIVTQDVESNWKRLLSIEKKDTVTNEEFKRKLHSSTSSLRERWPGLDMKTTGRFWEIIIPEEAETSHEDHFAQATERFLQYVAEGRLPEWEISGILAKYYTTTEANQDPQLT